MATGFYRQWEKPFLAKDATEAKEAPEAGILNSRSSFASFASFAVKPPLFYAKIVLREKINFHNVLDSLSHCDIMEFLLNC